MNDFIEILDSIWFDKIGIVRCLDKTTNEIKYYIGTGMGIDQRLDEEHIVAWGYRFNPDNNFFSRNVA